MKQWIVFLILFLQLFNLLESGEGTLIVLYGTQCAGKSTLAEALKESLRENYTIEKKTDLAEQIKKDEIYSATGNMPETREEVVQATLFLTPLISAKVSKAAKKAMALKIEEVGKRILQGENIILDVCLSHTELIDRIRGRHVSVLVYAPLSVLSERDKTRTRLFEQSKLFQQKRRASMLSLFFNLYRPVDSDQGEYLDILTRKETEFFFDVTKEEMIYPRLPRIWGKFMEQLHLNEESSVLIVPKVNPDILINTATQDTACSVKLIQDFIDNFLSG